MMCPSDETLAQLIDDELGDAERGALEAHIDDCGACRRLLAQCVRDAPPDPDGSAPESAPPTRPGHAMPPRLPGGREASVFAPHQGAWSALLSGALLPKRTRGSSVGRYLVVDVVGHGGMGIVYAAYDPELDRKVALKLLHADLTRSAELRNRMRREAKALARLSHPNVITVYDVGVDRGQLFIAMELIDGGTLGTWLCAAPRSVDEIVQQFVAAGRGLEAAHAAGLVHRDLKPANILVGRHGRVCVSDFGLVRVADEPVAPVAPIAGQLVGSLTQSGVLLGTPPYMAPEQLAGNPADARSDQFSFCVMLYEGLVGERPFEGKTLDELRAAVSNANLVDAMRGRKLPSWLRQILLCGLCTDPEKRYPSMAALLRDLGRDREHRRRRYGFAAAGLATLLAVAGVASSTRGRAFDCGAGDARLAGIWDAPTKASIQAAFRATGKPYADDVWHHVEGGGDAFALAWRRSYAEACEATHVRGEQSEQVLGLRMDCLNHRLDGVAALTDLFAHADGALLDRAASAVQQAADLASCADVRALTARLGPPRDPVARSAYDALAHRLAQLDALVYTYIPIRLRRTVDPVVEDARRFGHPLLLSDALRLQGQSRWYSGEWEAALAPLHQAVIAAQRGGDDDRATWAWDYLAIVLSRSGHQDEAERSLQYATAAGDRAGRTPMRLAGHLQAAAAVAEGGARVEEAASHFEEAAAAYRQAGMSVSAATCLIQAGEALANAWPAARAIDDCTRGLQQLDKLTTPRHPCRAQGLICLSGLAVAGNRPQDALVHARAAAEAVEGEFGRDGGPMFAYAHLAIARAANASGDFAGVLAAFDRAGTGGTVHIKQGLAIERARALIGLGRAREVLPALETLYAWTKANPVANETLSDTAFALARALDEAGRDRPRAVQLAEEAEALLARSAATPYNQQNRQAIERWLSARRAQAAR